MTLNSNELNSNELNVNELNSDEYLYEKLHLSKEAGKEIYVDENKIKLNQIEGIRFLYTNFVKRLPGVILNDPPGYGKSWQVVMFLSSIRKLLNKLENRILILCDINNLWAWKRKLEASGFCHDVAVESLNPYISKKVFINSVLSTQTFCQPHWSVVVVEGDRLIREEVSADYKIWITSSDVKTNLPFLATTYKWLYNDKEFNIGKFVSSGKCLKDCIRKSIQLNEFMDTFVLRRNAPLTSKKSVETSQSITSTETPKKVSKKNKDATGTKIKRSKKMPDQSPDPGNTSDKPAATDVDIKAIGDILKKQDHPSKDNYTNYSVNNNSNKDVLCNDNINEVKSEMDIESFIQNEKPIEGDDYIEYDFSNNNTDDSTDTMCCSSDAPDDIVVIEDKNKPSDASDYSIKSIQGSDAGSKPKLEHDSTGDTSGCKSENEDVLLSQTTCTNKASIASKKMEKQMNVNLENHENEVSSPLPIVSENFTNSKSPNKCMLDNNEIILNENVRKRKSTEKIKSKVSSESNNVTDKLLSSQNNDCTMITVNAKIDTVAVSLEEIKKDDIVKEKSNKSIDDKIDECEEKILKKFKGSLLDSLF